MPINPLDRIRAALRGRTQTENGPVNSEPTAAQEEQRITELIASMSPAEAREEFDRKHQLELAEIGCGHGNPSDCQDCRTARAEYYGPDYQESALRERAVFRIMDPDDVGAAAEELSSAREHAAPAGEQGERDWRRELDADLATRWAPSDLDRWLCDLADDPTVTDADYRDAQAAVNSAVHDEDHEGWDTGGEAAGDPVQVTREQSEARVAAWVLDELGPDALTSTDEETVAGVNDIRHMVEQEIRFREIAEDVAWEAAHSDSDVEGRDTSAEIGDTNGDGLDVQPPRAASGAGRAAERFADNVLWQSYLNPPDEDTLAHAQAAAAWEAVRAAEADRLARELAEFETRLLDRVVEQLGPEALTSSDPAIVDRIVEIRTDLGEEQWEAAHEREWRASVDWAAAGMTVEAARRVADGTEERERHDSYCMETPDSCGACAKDEQGHGSDARLAREQAAREVLARHERETAAENIATTDTDTDGVVEDSDPLDDRVGLHPELDRVEAAIRSLDLNEPITEESLGEVGVTVEQYQALLDELDTFTEDAASRAELFQDLADDQDSVEETADPSVEPADERMDTHPDLDRIEAAIEDLDPDQPITEDSLSMVGVTMDQYQALVDEQNSQAEPDPSDWDQAMRELTAQEHYRENAWTEARDAASWSPDAAENAYDRVLDDPYTITDHPERPWFDPDRAWSDPVDPARGQLVDETVITDARDRVFSALTGLDPAEHDTRELTATVRDDWLEDWTPSEMREHYRRDDYPVNRLGTQHEVDAELVDDADIRAAVEALTGPDQTDTDADDRGAADGDDQPADPAALPEGPTSSGDDYIEPPLAGTPADEATTQELVDRATSQVWGCGVAGHQEPDPEVERAKQLNRWQAEDNTHDTAESAESEDL